MSRFPIFPLSALALAILPACHHGLLCHERRALKPNGTPVSVNGHLLYVYTEGTRDPETPALIFLSGGGTPDPAYNFRSLYRLLSPAYQIAVVEKPGYGYAPAARAPRDVDTLLAETRQALQSADISPPYVLFPHSLSGIEALRWAQRYPQELWGIVGLDMAVPEVYRTARASRAALCLMRTAGWLGLQRLPFLSPTDRVPLTAEEYRQTRLLTFRNFCNPTVIAEARIASANAALVERERIPSLPVLLFVSDGEGLGPFWLPCQKRFADAVGCTLQHLNCGHYLHNHCPDAIALRCLPFLQACRPPQP